MKTNEMAIAFDTVQPLATDAETPYDAYGDETVTIGAPSNEYSPENITVYANSITPTSYINTDGIAAFDVVFSVGINCEGVSKTYQVVKRIGIDKCKIAQEACRSTPVSIVESKNAKLQEEARATAKRFRKLAGLE